VVGAEGSFTGLFRIGAGGELYIFNGDGQGGGEWLATGAKFATPEPVNQPPRRGLIAVPDECEFIVP